MNKAQKGFTLVEGLLILIVVGILTGTGWYVWNSRNKSDKSLDNSAKTSESTKTPVKTNVAAEANIPSDWLVYKDVANGIAFSYPPTWKATPASYSQQTVIITSPDIKEESMEPFGPGTKVTGGNRISLVFQAQDGKTLNETFNSSFEGNLYGNVQKESRQIDGASAYEYEFGYDSPVARYILFIKGTQYTVRGRLEGPDISKTSPGYDSFVKMLGSVVIK